MKTSKYPCPCGGGWYHACCQPYHLGQKAPSPEALMRSRYSAFARGDTEYLLRTWHPTTRPELSLDPDIQWQRLVIHSSTGAGLGSRRGTVHFSAYYRLPNSTLEFCQEEHSRFCKEQSTWYYLDGEVS